MSFFNGFSHLCVWGNITCIHLTVTGTTWGRRLMESSLMCKQNRNYPATISILQSFLFLLSFMARSESSNRRHGPTVEHPAFRAYLCFNKCLNVLPGTFQLYIHTCVMVQSESNLIYRKNKWFKNLTQRRFLSYTPAEWPQKKYFLIASVKWLLQMELLGKLTEIVQLCSCNHSQHFTLPVTVPPFTPAMRWSQRL